MKEHVLPSLWEWYKDVKSGHCTHLQDDLRAVSSGTDFMALTIGEPGLGEALRAAYTGEGLSQKNAEAYVKLLEAVSHFPGGYLDRLKRPQLDRALIKFKAGQPITAAYGVLTALNIELSDGARDVIIREMRARFKGPTVLQMWFKKVNHNSMTTREEDKAAALEMLSEPRFLTTVIEPTEEANNLRHILRIALGQLSYGLIMRDAQWLAKQYLRATGADFSLEAELERVRMELDAAKDTIARTSREADAMTDRINKLLCQGAGDE